ncbi:FecR family protein [Parasegetibacter sp. NRK P23]|uniref:FecR family protein n=1 Tax=Parasegetibacter sp. NRK P23 TaxID=2942999 RepID=UPI002043FBC7|nr:FecR family protein [Parasegetibacter sp. NRK P23]MCM5530364.1 FecR domain-containing protein [Parasegetibacter sp. NRK P23]
MAPFSNDPFYIASLITRARREEITPEERARLEVWIAENDAHRQLWDELNDPDMHRQHLQAMAGFNETAALERFWADKSEKQPVAPVRQLRAWKWAAAAVIVVISVSAYFFLRDARHERGLAGNGPRIEEVLPGKTGAILTLADGSQLVLDSMSDGTIATQNGTAITLRDNELVYDAATASGDVVSNTITTPKGRQYHLTLPDGTGVWLNAASSIEYPVAFKGQERRVRITGEVYFDVTKRSWQPFVVQTSEMTVEVLGTSFNINAYANERAVQTTLLTGAVKLTPILNSEKKIPYKVLVPGQTAVLNKPGDGVHPSLVVADTIDQAKITAWKNGLFNFDGEDLYSIMRQLERWYNIEVRYLGKPENVIFKGKMHRDTNLSDVLKVLEAMDVRFEWRDNILYVK